MLLLGSSGRRVHLLQDVPVDVVCELSVLRQKLTGAAKAAGRGGEAEEGGPGAAAGGPPRAEGGRPLPGRPPQFHRRRRQRGDHQGIRQKEAQQRHQKAAAASNCSCHKRTPAGEGACCTPDHSTVVAADVTVLADSISAELKERAPTKCRPTGLVVECIGRAGRAFCWGHFTLWVLQMQEALDV